ncbi:hypothetical protein [Sinomonas sp. ASV322]|uniref:hypothetical protein n=1 Tax=Sinomonas sp. ASV322 TaxID=3041920 RepID=UPI0027DCFAB4|nr:hypothetical protein [Sinomonas sp. ASV322]MDQ4504266.1 hypothetical protein [Sinomonas sp. ASV322]
MPTALGAGSSATPLEVLELRVHGVKNVPPQDMLCTTADDVTLVRDDGVLLGDSLAGFYTVKTPEPDAATRLEAYCWGNLDRFDRSTTFLGKIGRVLYNLGWFLIAPFGLANAAYWARSFRTDPSREDGLRTGPGGGVVRLYGLLLTLLLVSAVSTVAFDFIAVQCFEPTGVPNVWKICNALPPQFDGLRELTRGQRLATLSLAPIAAVALIALLAFVTNVRFRTRQADAARASNTDPRPGAVALALPMLWVRRRINSPTGLLHLAASVQLVVVLLMTDTASRDTTGAATSILSIAWAQLAVIGYFLVLWARSMRAPEARVDFWKSRYVWGAVLIGTAGATYFAAILVASGANTTNETGPFRAGQLTPTVLLVGLTLLATVGCVVRTGYNEWLATLVLAVGVGALVFAVGGWLDPLGWWANAAAVAVVIASGLGIAIPYLLRRGRDGRRLEHAWHGAAPGVFMYLGLLVGAYLASAVVLGTGEYLRAGRLQSLPDRTDPLFRVISIPTTAHDITMPTAFWAFGGVLVLLVVLVAGLFLALVWFRLRKAIIEEPPVDPTETRFERDIDSVRRTSAFVQRIEPLLHTVSWAIGVAVTVSLAFTVMQHARGATGRWAWVRSVLAGLVGESNFPAFSGFLQGIVLLSVVLGGLGIIGLAATNAQAGASRPLGLLWDLIAWLPRAAHPFGPACFFERAVPELADRMIRWLEPGGDAGPEAPGAGAPDAAGTAGAADSQRRVLLAAHSLGTVLAVAALFHLAALGRADLMPRVRLLTFGMQLRPYFGRFFPEIFGPEVLGTPGIAAPSFWSADPWKGKDLHDGVRPAVAPAAVPAGPAAVPAGPAAVPAGPAAVPSGPAAVLAEVPSGPAAVPSGPAAVPAAVPSGRAAVPAAAPTGPVAAGAPRVGASSLMGASRGTPLTALLDIPHGAFALATGPQPVWINLWRRTDYLGFPGYSYSAMPNNLDRLVLEMEPDSYMARVATHANYLPTRAYAQARKDLLVGW